MSFASLLAPMTVDAFLAEHWERAPLVLANPQRDRFESLFNARDFDRLISAGIVDRPDGRIVKSGATDSSIPLFHGDGRANIAVVHQAYAEGHTIVVNNVHQRNAHVAQLGRDIEEVLGQPIGANAYLTPRGAQGLASHFDDHDVFVLQCEGSKEWRIHEPLVELPLPDQHFDLRPEQVGTVVAEFCLEAGDVLYMPRGYVHVAAAAGEPSLHLTLGITAYRVYDVLAKALWHAAREEVAYRHATPPRARAKWRDELRATLRVLAKRFASTADLDLAIRDVESDLIGRLHALPDADVGALDRLDRIALPTRVRKRRGALCLVIVEGDAAVLQFPGNAMSAPAGAAEALHYIAAQEAFVVGDLPASITDDAKIVLAKRLVMMGLLVVE